MTVKHFPASAIRFLPQAIALAFAACTVSERIAEVPPDASENTTTSCTLVRTVRDLGMSNYATFEYSISLPANYTFSITVSPRSTLSPYFGVAAFYKLPAPAPGLPNLVTAVGRSNGTPTTPAKVVWTNNTGVNKTLTVVAYSRSRSGDNLLVSLRAYRTWSGSTNLPPVLDTFDGSAWVQGHRIASNYWPGCENCTGDLSEFTLSSQGGLGQVAFLALNTDLKGMHYYGGTGTGSQTVTGQSHFLPGGEPNFLLTYLPWNPKAPPAFPTTKWFRVVQRNVYVSNACL